MDDSLLVSLRSYRRRQDRDPLEDFITEAFAWTLRTHPSLSEKFLDEIDSQSEVSSEPVQDELKWETQVNLADGNIADMVRWGGDRAYVFEHKVGSKARAKQLHRYREAVYADEVITVLITGSIWNYTAPTAEKVRPPDLRITWSDVYEMFDDWRRSTEEATERVEDFLALLDHEGLGPQDPLAKSELRAFAIGKDVTDELYRLMKIIRERFDWSFLYETLPDQKEKNSPTLPSERWGRFGLRLYTNWSPGLFTGILVDPDDHDAELANPKLGPDLTVILDIGSGRVEGRFQEVATSEPYVDLCERLRELTNWKVDARSANEAAEKNQSHPILIQRPLAHVLRGKSSIEDQQQAIYEVLREGIKHFLDEDGRIFRVS